MAFTRTQLIIAAGVALVLFLVLAALLIWWHRRRRVPRSKHGFTAASPFDEALERAVAPPSPAGLKLQKFLKARADQVSDVLLDYVKIKESKAGVYRAQPTPDSCVWWMGEKYPSHPKGISAAVMAGLSRSGEFRSKVIVLHDLPEAAALARALARAAKPSSGPVLFDAWNMPIAFSGFPLRASDGIVITELGASDAAGATPAQTRH